MSVLAAQADWVEEDSHACLKECVCLPDGGACTLTGACAADHLACKAGFRRASDGTAKCLPIGCANGTWQVCHTLTWVLC